VEETVVFESFLLLDLHSIFVLWLLLKLITVIIIVMYRQCLHTLLGSLPSKFLTEYWFNCCTMLQSHQGLQRGHLCTPWASCSYSLSSRTEFTRALGLSTQYSHFSPQQTSVVLSPSLVECLPKPPASALWLCGDTVYNNTVTSKQWTFYSWHHSMKHTS